MPRFTVFEGVVEGNRFFSTYDSSDMARYLANGVLAYRILGHTETVEEAQRLIDEAPPVLKLTAEEIELSRAMNYHIGFSGQGPTALDVKPARLLTNLEAEVYKGVIKEEKSLRRSTWREAVLEGTGEDINEMY